MMPSMRRREAEEYYLLLKMAARIAPDPGIFDQMLYDACEEIAKGVDPQNMTDIRKYGGDDRLTYDLIGHLLERHGDAKLLAQADANEDFYLLPEQIGADTILAAPVETADELIRWLMEQYSVAQTSQ